MDHLTNQKKHIMQSIRLDVISDIPQHWTDRAKGGRFRMKMGPDAKTPRPSFTKSATGYVNSTYATDQYVMTKGITSFVLNWKR